jgi:hypothetical protein
MNPITRVENFLSRIAGDGGKILTPITRIEWFLQRIIDKGGGGGGWAVQSVNGKTGDVVLTASDVGAAPAETTVTVSGTAPTIEPQANTIYNCGELTSLTISNPSATGKYSIVFFSGVTPTTTVGIENFVAEANKRYKITVEDNYATYDSWPYTPT